MRLISFDEDTSFTMQHIAPAIITLQNSHVLLGLAYCFVAAIGFGSMQIPILRYNKGNGALAQFGAGVGILIGSIIHATYNEILYVNIYPMFGGCLWAIANFASFFVIDIFGFGIALLLWNVGNCVTGWMTGYYGLFGIKSRRAKDFTTNISGVILIIISGIIFSFVKKKVTHYSYNDTVSLPTCNRAGILIHEFEQNIDNRVIIKEKNFKKVLALVVALICGFFYASTTTPIYYLLDNPNELGISENNYTSSTFVLSLGLGIFITTSLIFFCSIYLYGLRSDVLGNKDIMFSSIISGFIWLNSMCFMLKAIDIVAQTITYPIMSICPGVIGIMWSIFYFKEIHGIRNYLTIMLAILIAGCGIFLLVISKL